jgi:hypothetical protein
MLNKIKAMHSNARKYCIDESNKWKTIYADLLNNRKEDEATAHSSTDQDKRTFPRYNVLDVILSTIEESVPEDFKSIDELRSYLILSTQLAESLFTKTEDPIEKGVIAEERENVKRFFEFMKAEYLTSTELLPFRRTLLYNECASLEVLLEKTWGQWYAGHLVTGDEKSVLTLHSIFLENCKELFKIQDILAQLGNKRIFELREDGLAIEVDLELANFAHDLGENFWAPADMRWMIYASHKSSITFAGEHLIKQVWEKCPDWNKYVYKGRDLNKYDL